MDRNEAPLWYVVAFVAAWCAVIIGGTCLGMRQSTASAAEQISTE
ncbi:hypothetical protein SAMN05192570_1155 [Brevundimonas viscosa]|uniref:Uncharacterized protein n=1 Tax=Brevundimonas viscosa TaxID=871741 RepID=A0A1I6PPG9_9CAUL|nr:hypothetical protein SAMN05192570_1155 [Brevundimonas viscosa]